MRQTISQGYPLYAVRADYVSGCEPDTDPADRIAYTHGTVVGWVMRHESVEYNHRPGNAEWSTAEPVCVWFETEEDPSDGLAFGASGSALYQAIGYGMTPDAAEQDAVQRARHKINHWMGVEADRVARQAKGSSE